MTYAMINAYEVNNEFICSIVDFPNDPDPIVMTICVVKNELEINKISDANFLAIGEKFLSIISTSLCELCEKEKALLAPT